MLGRRKIWGTLREGPEGIHHEHLIDGLLNRIMAVVLRIASLLQLANSIDVDLAAEDRGHGAGQGDAADVRAVADTVDDKRAAVRRPDRDGKGKPVLRHAHDRRGDRTRAAGERLRLDAALVGADVQRGRPRPAHEVDVRARRLKRLRPADASPLAVHIGPREVLDRHDRMRHAGIDEVLPEVLRIGQGDPHAAVVEHVGRDKPRAGISWGQTPDSAAP